jgi:hypothetical protein
VPVSSKILFRLPRKPPEGQHLSRFPARTTGISRWSPSIRPLCQPRQSARKWLAAGHGMPIIASRVGPTAFRRRRAPRRATALGPGHGLCISRRRTARPSPQRTTAPGRGRQPQAANSDRERAAVFVLGATDVAPRRRATAAGNGGRCCQPCQAVQIPPAFRRQSNAPNAGDW